MITHPRHARITPLGEDERDESMARLLAALRQKPDGPELNIFATLARHPELFKAWLTFGGYLLGKGDLPARDREILTLRTALDCGSRYEWGQHIVIAAAAGLTQEEIARIAAGPGDPAWAPFDAALLRAADELHAWNCISDATWQVLASRYSDRQLIELCMLVGQYHLVAYTLNTLGVQPEPGVEGLPTR
ncbi:MAG: carboxymuconolactone decarboxylase family protein [Micromonosporaceae bacterium]